MNWLSNGRHNRLTAIAVLLSIFFAVFLLTDGLNFPAEKDELHFWPTAQFFSHDFPPTVVQLRTYNDLNTPLPFLIFGAAEHFFHRGISLGRLINLLAALGCALLVLFAPGKLTPASVKSTLALLGFPYFFGVSTHLYTDPLAAAFSLAGVVAFLRGRNGLAFLLFAAAISSRQYAVVFPGALLVVLSFAALKDRGAPARAPTLALLLSVGVLIGWFLFWRGPANPVALEAQVVATSGWASLLPHNAGYFLACLGVYFVLPEAILFPEERRHLLARLRNRKTVLVSLVVVLGFFALFPPLGNVAPYPFKEMGFMDKALRYFLNDFCRVSLLALCAWLACFRFLSLSLGSIFVFFYAVLMAKAHVAWDKYALIPLVVLWWLKAESSVISKVWWRSGSAETPFVAIPTGSKY